MMAKSSTKLIANNKKAYHDYFILDTYEEFEEDVESSMIPISNEGRVNMLLDIRIQFPCQNDPFDDILE